MLLQRYFEINSNRTILYIYKTKQGVKKEVAFDKFSTRFSRNFESNVIPFSFFFFVFNLHVESSVVPLVRLHCVQSVRRARY